MIEKIVKRDGKIIRQLHYGGLDKHITEHVIGTYAENEPITVKPRKKEKVEKVEIKEDENKEGEEN